MALMPRNLPLPILPPTPPDRFLCHRQYGAQPILHTDCQVAIELDWPNTHTYQTYFLRDPRPSNAESIPIYSYAGSCRVALETAGPQEHLPHTMSLRPWQLRGFAGYLIHKCAVEGGGVGGWMTLGFTSALSWIHDASNETWGGNFLTISIQPRAHLGIQTVEPGSRDANIAALLSTHVAGLGLALGDLGGKLYYDLVAQSLRNRALEMAGSYNPNLTWWSKDGHFSWWARRFNRLNSSSVETSEPGSSTNNSSSVENLRPNMSMAEADPSGAPSGNFTLPSWWDDEDSGDEGDDEKSSGETNNQSHTGDETPYATASEGGDAAAATDRSDENNQEMHGLGLDVGDMTYQCDDSLGGGPDPVDCEKLSWSGLKPPNSIETLKPNVPNFYTQGTCGFAVSSLAPTTILWSHLLTAFETLNMFCVQNPIARVKGGRAYYGRQRVSSWINGKARRKQKKRDLSSTRVAATEALPKGINATIFRHDPKSLMSCEWVLAEEGKNLSSCRGD